jgi:hypothetical protein
VVLILNYKILNPENTIHWTKKNKIDLEKAFDYLIYRNTCCKSGK